MLKIFDLKCEYFASPIGISEQNPRFSFRVKSSENTESQSAYRITLAKSAEALESECYLYDSGKIYGNQCYAIRCNGAALSPFSSYAWRVTVWDDKGGATTSEIAFFETGAFSKDDWKAAWISAKDANAPTLVRMPFTLPNKDDYVRERLFIASTAGAFGPLTFCVNQAYVTLNGKRVGNDELFPGQISEKKRRALYSSYNIKDLTQNGENVLGAVILSDAFSAFIVLERHDGKINFISLTDNALSSSAGPYTLWDDGVEDQGGKLENYDATKELVGFDMPGGHFDSMKKAQFVHPPKIICAQTAKSTVIESIPPVSVRKIGGTHFLLDFGKTINGHIYLPIKNPTRGKRISIAYAEAILPNGELNPTSTINFQRGEFGPHIDSYIPRGDEYEIYEPRFSNHSFRYAMIINFPAEMWTSSYPDEIFLARAQMVHSPILKLTSFSCSDSDINKLYEISHLSERDNLVTIPTDCPSRERHGWLGDALVTAETECIQFDILNLLESWLSTIEDDQNESGNLQYRSPCMSDRINGKIDIPWCCAAVMIPYFVYMEYGDKNILEKSFAMIERWCHFIDTLKDENGYVKNGVRWGDHTALETMDHDWLGLIYYCFSMQYAAKIADILGKDATYFKSSEKNAKVLLKNQLIDNDGFGGGRQGDLAHALALRLAEGEEAEKYAQLLIEDIEKNDYRLTCGALGIYHLINVLSELGYHDVIYKIAKRDGKGSFLYWVKHFDATTAFENLDYTDWQSRNHPFLMGSLNKWFYEGIAGIRKTSPAYESFTVSPYLTESFNEIKTKIETPYGIIDLAVKKDFNKLTYAIEVPFGTEAKLFLENGEYKMLTHGKYFFEI